MRRRLFIELRLVFRRALRLITFRPIATHPASLRPITVVVVLLFAGVIGVAYDAVVSGGTGLTFSEYGITASLACWALMLAAIVLLMHKWTPRLSWALSDIATVGVAASVGLAIIYATFLATGVFDSRKTDWTLWIWHGLTYGVLGLSLLMVWRAGRSLWWGEGRFPGLRMVTAVLLPLILIPHQPTIYGDGTNWSRTDVWSLSRRTIAYLAPEQPTETEKQNDTWPPDGFETTLYRQSELVNRATGKLKPSLPGASHYFLVAAAPNADQDVFSKEVQSVRALFDERFGTRGRSIVLINSPTTLDTVPLASVTNIGVAVREIGKVMDREHDVLVLFMTSHGAKGIVSVDILGYPLNQITPESLAAALDSARIKNRVLIISACHSGSFIPRLQGSNTLIIAAASADRTSFGCANGRDWTYFGDALFNHALREETSFIKAFARADALIKSWEFWHFFRKPSQPQISVGSDIAKVLEAMDSETQDRRAETAIDIYRGNSPP
jgi:hypothetical protein